jgi:hypothetical protein
VSGSAMAEMRINSAVVCGELFYQELLLILDMSSKLHRPISNPVSVDKICHPSNNCTENVSLAEAQLLEK